MDNEFIELIICLGGYYRMRFDQYDKAEYRDILLYRIEENGIYPFSIQKITLKNHKGIPHRHGYFQVIYVSKGRLEHCINNEAFELIKGDLIVIPPYIPHATSAYVNESCEALELNILPEFINESFANNANVQSFMDFMYIKPFMVSEHKVRPKISLAGKVEMDVERLVFDILHEFNERKMGFELIVKSMILRLLAVAGREVTSEIPVSGKDNNVDSQDEAILRAIQYLEENYTKRIYLDDVVKVSLLCHAYFCTAFKRITHKSFTRYLNELRVSKAKEFLRETDLKIIEISNETGFNNVTHFNRTFKQVTLMTPNQYKKVSRISTHAVVGR